MTKETGVKSDKTSGIIEICFEVERLI